MYNQKSFSVIQYHHKPHSEQFLETKFKEISDFRDSIISVWNGSKSDIPQFHFGETFFN